jgi:hypothetical protein
MLEMREPTVDQDQVDGTFTDDLVDDVNIRRSPHRISLSLLSARQ